jgi:hypothetical protein
MALVWVAAVSLNRGYEPRFLGIGSEEFRRVARAGVAVTAIVAFTAYVTSADVARHYVLVVLPLATVLTLVERYGLRRRLHRQRRRGRCMHRVVVVGHEPAVLDMIHRLGAENYHGLHVVAACLPKWGQRKARLAVGVPAARGFDKVSLLVRLWAADAVVVLASPDLGPEQLRRLAWDLETTGADLLVAPSLVEVTGPRLSIRACDRATAAAGGAARTRWRAAPGEGDVRPGGRAGGSRAAVAADARDRRGGAGDQPWAGTVSTDAGRQGRQTVRDPEVPIDGRRRRAAEGCPAGPVGT